VHFFFSTLLQFYLIIIPCIIILFLHLLSTNYKCTQLCCFSPGTQTYCSEDGYEEFFDEEF
jgi:hypothetical protein